jgi:heterodisulfide reductase subunit D
MNVIEQLIDQTATYYCLDCGVCTGSCPVSRVFPTFSPRLIVERSLHGLEELTDDTIWSCLTCARCSVRCPAKINFPEFIRLVRDEAQRQGFSGMPAHHGMLQAIMALQSSGVKQNRNFWIDSSTRISKDSDTLYFVGCRPFFDIIFRDVNAGAIQGARNAVKLLNAVGIEPQVSENERCCGHDALWNGDEKRFEALARLNVEMIRQSGAKRVVFSCPEGYHTFREYYPKYVGDLDFEIVQFNELLADKLAELTLRPHEEVLTYHDPCRLGRMSHIYDAPRELIRKIPGVKLVEMERSRENGVCCGTSGWMNCSSCSKSIQLERLQEAQATGATTVVTACPKCAIHFNCAIKYFDLGIQVKELVDLLAENIIVEE